MNIWESLRLPEDHRTPSKVYSAFKKHEKTEFPCIVQEKVEGVDCIIVRFEGELRAFTNTGRPFLLMDDLLQLVKVRSAEVRDTAYFCTVCEVGFDKYLALTDIMPISDFIKGESLPFSNRQAHLRHELGCRFPAYEPFSTTCYSEEALEMVKAEIKYKGGDSLIIRNPVSKWVAGRKTINETICKF